MTHLTDTQRETLAQHVIDRDGLVWRLVHDGGMATRAHYAGIISIGIVTLERESGPLIPVSAIVAPYVEALERVEALHGETYRSVGYQCGKPIYTTRCAGCGNPAPCPTMRAAGGES